MTNSFPAAAHSESGLVGIIQRVIAAMNCIPYPQWPHCVDAENLGQGFVIDIADNTNRGTRTDDRPLLLDHAQWAQDHDVS